MVFVYGIHGGIHDGAYSEAGLVEPPLIASKYQNPLVKSITPGPPLASRR
jgi:hypothetical protein